MARVKKEKPEITILIKIPLGNNRYAHCSIPKEHFEEGKTKILELCRLMKKKNTIEAKINELTKG